MTLLEEIQSKCPPEMVEARQYRQIADLISAGRTRPTRAEIGNGIVLERLGLEQGNALLDAVYANETFRHVRPLLEQGRLVVGSPIVAQALNGLVSAGVITQSSADALIALGSQPDPVSIEQVIHAMEVL